MIMKSRKWYVITMDLVQNVLDLMFFIFYSQRNIFTVISTFVHVEEIILSSQ